MSSIIVKMEGGLGNQLLQYMFGLSLSSLHKKPVYFDITEYVSNRGIRKFALLELNLPGSFISCIIEFNTQIGNVYLKKIIFHQRSEEHPIITSLKLVVINEKNIQFSPNYLIINSGYFSGYWQSYKYWDNVTERLTWLNNILDLVAIQRNLQISPSDNSAIHIRRGDYLHTDHINWHGVCEENFYRKAVHLLDSKTNVFFSDDSTYVDNQYTDIRGFKNISQELNNEIDEFLTIRTFKKIVISNSSYSYMAAMLASIRQDDCMVVAPYPWYSWTDTGPDFLPGWTKLNRVTGQSEFQDKVEEDLAKVTVVVYLHTNTAPVDRILDMLDRQTLKPIQIFFVGKGLQQYLDYSSNFSKLKSSDLCVSFWPDLDQTQILFSLINKISGHYIAIFNEEEIWHEEKLRSNVNQAIRLKADIVLNSIYRLLIDGSNFLPEIYGNIDSSRSLKNRCVINFLFNQVSILITKAILLKFFEQKLPLSITDQQVMYELAICNAKKITSDDRLVWILNSNLNQNRIDIVNTNNVQVIDWMLQDSRVGNDVLFGFYNRVLPEVQSKFTLLQLQNNNSNKNIIFLLRIFLKKLKVLILKIFN